MADDNFKVRLLERLKIKIGECFIPVEVLEWDFGKLGLEPVWFSGRKPSNHAGLFDPSVIVDILRLAQCRWWDFMNQSSNFTMIWVIFINNWAGLQAKPKTYQPEVMARPPKETCTALCLWTRRKSSERPLFTKLSGKSSILLNTAKQQQALKNSV